jgi:hypothetical protein
MAVQIPTLSELYTSIKGDLESEIGINLPLFGKSYIRGLASVQAGKLKLYYLAIASTQKNIFPDLAESELTGGTLERFGRVKLNRNPFSAVAGEYEVTVTGEIGAVIPVNTTFKSDDNSVNPSKIFVLDTAFTFVAVTGTITIRSLDLGLDSKLSIGNTLTATAPLLNANESVVITSETTAPLSAETLDDYRDKVVEAYRLEPQGGAGADYRLWSKDAQGVLQSYPFARFGYSNEVIVHVEATLADSSDGRGTPTNSILEDVTEVIEFDPDVTQLLSERGRRPLGVFNVEVRAVIVRNIDITILNFQGLTPVIEAKIFNYVQEKLTTVRPFVGSVDILSEKNDILNDSKIISYVLDANSGIFNGLSFTVSGVPTITKTFIDGDIPYLNSITYV